VGGPHALIACVPEDFHEIAPLAAAVFLRSRGWPSIYLGPNVSFEMLKMALRRKHAELIILSCNIEPEEKTLQSWLQDITQHLQPSCTVAVGGPGFRPYAHLLSTHNISYFNQVQDVKAVKPRTRIPYIESAVGHSSFTPWVS
jgi:cobalamin-dependent methionine synthase I